MQVLLIRNRSSDSEACAKLSTSIGYVKTLILKIQARFVISLALYIWID